jgi:predicted nucleic acid-binding protein
MKLLLDTNICIYIINRQPEAVLKHFLAYGDIRAALEKTGTPVGSMGMLIAAQAVAGGVTLITHNIREFSRISGLTVINWAGDD